jgi:hypothetical protein
MAKGRYVPDGGENELPFRDWINKEGYRPAPLPKTPGGHWYIQSGYFIEFDSRDDLFVYCVSHSQPRKMEEQFASGDDSWVEIFDADEFFGAIDKEMAALGHTPKGLKPVLYRSRRFPHGAVLPADAELIKKPPFMHEDEARACWKPANLPIDKLPLVIPELTKCCRIHRKVVR